MSPSTTSRPSKSSLAPRDDESNAPPDTATPEASAEPEAEESDVAPEPADPPVEGAWPGAGGGRPADAQQLTMIEQSIPEGPVAIVQSPTGNIACDVITELPQPEPSILKENGTYCEVLSTTFHHHNHDPNPGAGQIRDGVLTVPGITDKLTFPSTIEWQPNALHWFLRDPLGQVLPYGTVWYHDTWAIGSLETGLTVWNTETGAGALFNRRGIHAFEPDGQGGFTTQYCEGRAVQN